MKVLKDFRTTIYCKILESFCSIPFYNTGLFLYLLKTSENLIFLEGIERDLWHEMKYSVLQ